MKVTVKFFAALAIFSSVITIAVANAESSADAVSVLASSVLRPSIVGQDEVVSPPTIELVAPGPGEAALTAPSVMMEPVELVPPIMAVPVDSSCCPTPCCPTPCCPTPCKCCPPTPTVFCLQDPCGCGHEACINVPACCAGEEPYITWKKGIFGRQIATVCWKCCDHDVKVIVCRRGRVIVRD